MNRFWLDFFRQPYWDKDAGGGGADAGGGDGADGGASGADKGGDGGSKSAGGGEGGGQKDGGAGEQKLSLRATLAQRLQGDERTDFERWSEQYSTDDEWVKSTVSLRRGFDARVPVPKADDKPEVVSKYFERVGKPPKAADYKYDFGKDEKGEPVKLTDREVADFEGYKEHAHKHHFTQAQFEAGINLMLERDRKQTTEFDGQIKQAHQRSVDQLRAEWGADFDNNVNHAVEGGIIYAESAEAWTSFVNLPMANGMRVGDHPTFIKTFAKIGRMTGEDQLARNMRTSGEAENVKAEIARIEDEAMKAGELPSDKKWHERLEPLYKKLYPKKHTGGSAGYGMGGGQ
jgi:hypothetical protein